MFLSRLRKFPVILLLIFILATLFYSFSYLVPFTSNSFVVANITPVAADVSGFITDIYVQNGDLVEKNTPLFRIFQNQYKFTYAKTQADYQAGISHLHELKNMTSKNEELLDVAKSELAKAQYDYKLKANPLVKDAVSTQEIKDLLYQTEILKHKLSVLKQQLKIDSSQIEQQIAKNQALLAELDEAKTNLDLTVVKAQSDGIIDNLYINKGTQVSPNQPLFSIINTDDFYVQANFNEIDLRNVRKGDECFIVPRVYFGSKVYHGLVVSNVWDVNRQENNSKNQLQTVTQTENNWIFLPQRLPVQIKITDYDGVIYPLSIGSSCYVYIKTHKR